MALLGVGPRGARYAGGDAYCTRSLVCSRSSLMYGSRGSTLALSGQGLAEHTHPAPWVVDGAPPTYPECRAWRRMAVGLSLSRIGLLSALPRAPSAPVP